MMEGGRDGKDGAWRRRGGEGEGQREKKWGSRGIECRSGNWTRRNGVGVKRIGERGKEKEEKEEEAKRVAKLE